VPVLLWQGADYRWGISGVNYDAAFRNIVRGVVLAASGAGPPDVGHEGQGRGCIVSIPSVKGLGPIGSSIAYAVSNASPIHLTRCITIISPDSSRSLSGSGGGETALIERNWASLCPPDISKSLRTPQQRGAALRPAFPRYSVKA
jgi:hypothetical protein